MALISNGRYCRIAHVTVDPSTLSGSVRVDVFPSQQSFYELGESPVQLNYPVQWLRNANYPLDAYSHLLTLSDFAGGMLDDEDLPDNGGTLVLPPRPSVHHFAVNGEWEVDLVAVKAEAREKITSARNSEERAGFTVYGKLFDSDAVAVQRISVAAQAATVAISAGMTGTRSWTCADDTSIELTYEQIAMLPVIMTEAADTLHVKARALKADIEAAETFEQVEAVIW